MRLIQPWDGLTPDPAILLEIGGPRGVARWLPTNADVDICRLAGATTEPQNGDPWPVPRTDLSHLALVGPAPRYNVDDPNRTKTKASDFFQ